MSLDPARIVVCVPTLNEEAHIEATLDALIGTDPRMQAVRIVVADGGSTDRTRAIVEAYGARRPNVALMDNPDRLQSAAVNRVARAAAGHADVLVRCDAHAGYPPGFVLAAAEAMVRAGADSCVVPMDSVGRGCFQRAVAGIVDTPFGSGGSAHRGGRASGWVDHGHHAAFRLAKFLEVGGYDETFSHNEDAEFDMRLAKAGGRIWLDAGVRLDYYPRGTARGLWRQYRKYGEGRARTVLKHAVKPRLRQLIPPINLVLLVVSVAAGFVHPIGWAYAAAYGAALVGLSLWMAAKLKSACGLHAGTALFVMHQAWAIGFLARIIRGRG